MQGIKGFNNLDALKPSAGQPAQGKSNNLKGPSFEEALKSTLGTHTPREAMKAELAKATSKIEFSNHAVDRMRLRGIHFTPEQLGKIENAISKASAKGAKETLVLADNAAMIVNVKSNKVVTVMDKTMLKENVFTNIDSTVMI